MKSTAARYWPDIEVGETFTTGSLTITRSDILEFAADFDPQPYHLDSAAADASIFGGLCASGWHVTALMMRLLSDCFASEQIALCGATSVGKLRWRKPVFAEDTLSSTITITDRRAGSSSAYGSIDCAVQVTNQHNDVVIVLTTTLMISNPGEVPAHA